MAWAGNTEAPMAGHTPWGQSWRHPLDTPESATHSAASRRALADARRLEALWQAGQVPWVEPPADANAYLATLRASIENLGGRLVLTAVFPEGAAPLAPAAEATEDGHATVPARPAGGQGH